MLIIGGALLVAQRLFNPADLGGGLGMLYFHAEWCKICQAMEPIVDGLEERYRSDFPIVHINIDTARGKQLAREYGFIGQPTFILFDSSGEEVRRLMGAQSHEVLEREIEWILEK